MAFKFYPLTVIESCSLSNNAKLAETSSITPTTASFADFAVNAVGPTGAQYKIVFATGPTN